jgi:hypothetical protein
MKKTASKKKSAAGTDDKAKVSTIVDEIIAECLPLPDPTVLFSKIRELENTPIDYTTVLSRKFSKSSISEQDFMINHLFPHLKRLSLSESLNAVLLKETFAPRILVDILHYLIRSDTMVDNQLLERANKAEEIANHLATLLEESASLESLDSEKLFSNFNKTCPALQLGILMELFHLKGEKILPLFLHIFKTKNKVAPKIIDFLGSRADTGAVYLLTQILTVTEDKELSKGIKKTLYRLKNKGIELASPDPLTAVPAPTAEVPLPSPTAYVTTMDPLGERLILAVKPKDDQELTILQFLVSDQKGINDLIASVTTPKDFEQYLTRISTTKDITMVEVALDYCHLLIKESSQRNHISGTKIPANYFLWKKFFGSYDTALEKPAMYTLLPADAIQSEAPLLKRSEDLIAKYTFTFWLLDWKLLVNAYQEIHELENSPLVLSEPQKESRIHEIVQKTAQAFFDDKNRLLFQRRLEESAYILWKTDKQDDAKSAFAAALAFAPKGVPSDNHPFALKTVEKNLAFLKEQSQKEKRSESGQIILP